MNEITIDEAHSVIRAEYYDDVSGVVDSLRDAIMDGELEDEDAAETWLNETVDGHERVTHLGPALECLRYCSSNNEDAYTDLFGEAPPLDSGSINWAALSYYAFMAEIQSNIDITGWLAEKEELDDEAAEDDEAAQDDEDNEDEDNEDEDEEESKEEGSK